MTPAELATVERACRDLTVRAETLLPIVAALAREAYTVRWDLEDAVAAARMSDEVVAHLDRLAGLDALEDAMFELCQEASTAVDCSPPNPPAWFVKDQRDRWMRRQAASQ